MSQVTLETHRSDRHVLVSLSGEVDLSCSEQVRQALLDVLGQAPAPSLLCCDLTAVSFLDSTGLSALVAGAHASEDAGTEMTLAGAHGSVKRVLELSGVGTLFRQFESVQEFETAAAAGR